MKNFFVVLNKRFVFVLFCALLGGFVWSSTNFFIHQASAVDHARELLYSHYELGVEPRDVVCRVLFSPDDDIEATLIGLIEAEQEAIYAAQYLISSKAIAQALIAAHERGIYIEIVTDKFCTRSPVGKAKMLANAGIKILEYEPRDKIKRGFKKDSLMHHKFFIFKKTIDNKCVLATGSYNCTVAAAHENQENCIFLEDPKLVSAFTYQFKRLKKRSGVFK